MATIGRRRLISLWIESLGKPEDRWKNGLSGIQGNNTDCASKRGRGAKDNRNATKDRTPLVAIEDPGAPSGRFGSSCGASSLGFLPRGCG